MGEKYSSAEIADIWSLLEHDVIQLVDVKLRDAVLGGITINAGTLPPNVAYLNVKQGFIERQHFSSGISAVLDITPVADTSEQFFTDQNAITLHSSHNYTGTIWSNVNNVYYAGTGTISSLKAAGSFIDNQSTGIITLARNFEAVTWATLGEFGTLVGFDASMEIVGGSVDNYYGVRVAVTNALPPVPSNPLEYSVGVAVAEWNAANRTNLLLGTLTIPSGTWNIYSSSTRLSYFAGDVAAPNLREKLTANRTYYVRAALGTCTMTIASPCVVTKTTHGLSANDPIVFSTTGALPTGLVPGTVYYVKAINANTFNVAATPGGSNINTSGSQSGTHSVATGNDSNNGSAATRASAFLTMQKAWDAIVGLDLNGFIPTIQLADSTYSTGISASVAPVGGTVIINGNSSTPANVIVSSTASCILLNCPAIITVQNFEVSTSGGGTSGLVANKPGASIIVGAGMRFGTVTLAHMRAVNGGLIYCASNYSIVGNAPYHYQAQLSGIFELALATVTLTGTPAFSNAFLYLDTTSVASAFSMTYSGAATGKRYDISTAAAAQTYGGGANYFPGSIAGTTATGGQYA